MQHDDKDVPDNGVVVRTYVAENSWVWGLTHNDSGLAETERQSQTSVAKILNTAVTYSL